MVRVIVLRFFETYFRHRWLYLLPIIITASIAFIYLVTIEHQYDSKSVMFVQNDSFLATLTSVRDTPYSYVTPAQETSGELGELLQTESFLRAIVSETDLESEMSGDREAINDLLTEVGESIWVQTLGNNQIMVHAIHPDPALAYQLSAATTEAYIQWKINLDKIESGAAEGFFADLISDYKTEVEQARGDLRQYLVTHPTIGDVPRPETEQMELDQLQAAFAQATTRYEQALEKDENARLATAQAESDIRNSYFVIDAPRIPESPTTSLRQTAQNVGIFLATGVILSLAAISGAALLDRSFRFPLDVHQNLNLPVLTTIPDITPKRRFWQRKKVDQIDDATTDEEKLTQPDEEQDETTPIPATAISNGGSPVEKKERVGLEPQADNGADNIQESADKVTI